MPQLPNPAARRRNDRAGWTTLPAEGMDGPPPKWPLDGQSKEEAQIWAHVWTLPQAFQWDRMGLARTVALYCRVTASAEDADAKVTMISESNRMAKALGLTPEGMRALRWLVSDAEPVADESGEVTRMDDYLARAGAK